MNERGLVEALDEVRAAVASSFAGVRPPAPGNVALCPCEECRGVRASLTPTNACWKDVPAETIIANFDKLPLLTPEAFHYYLPAFITHALKHWRCDRVWEFTVYALTPKERPGENEGWLRERFGRLTPPQMHAIYAFLDLLLADTQNWFMWTQADKGKRVLSKYMG